MRQNIIVTTSWDDGDPMDAKVLDLLRKYGIQGTFYVPIKNNANEVISRTLITNIAATHEIGAHTYNHVNLPALPLSEAEKEIREGKTELENITGNPVRMFCYPMGRYNRNILDIVKKTGFAGARTTKRLETDFPKDRFQMGTTIQVHPLYFRKNLTSCLYNKNLKGFFDTIKNNSKTLEDLVDYYLDYITIYGGILHIWGHSYEIEKYGMWHIAEKIFKKISKINGINYFTNGELLHFNGTK